MQRSGLDTTSQYRKKDYINEVLKYFLKQKGSHRIASHRIASHRIASYRIASPQRNPPPPPHIAPHRTATSHCMCTGLTSSDMRKEEMTKKLESYDAKEVVFAISMYLCFSCLRWTRCY
jgi:hypothetical protein